MDNNLKYNERKQWAKLLYTKHGKSYTDIALEVDVEEAAVRLWVKEDRWNDIKTSLLISKRAQLERYYAALEAIEAKRKEDAVPVLKDIEQAIKYTTAIKNLEEETSLPYVVQVAEEFTTWLLRRDINFAHRVSAEFTAFVHQFPD